MLEWWQMALLVATGLVGGTAGGFLGIGGTVLFMPLLKMICDAGPGAPLDAHTAIAATLVVNVCVGASGTIGHVRAGRVMAPIIKVLIPCSIVASVAGVAAGNLFAGGAQVWLWRLFGALVAYVVAMNAYWMVRPLGAADLAPGEADPARPKGWAVGLVGLVVGFSSGLLGVGGGAIAVPAQQMLLRLRLRSAIANSAVTVIFSCLLAAVLKHATLAARGESLARPWILIGLLAPPAIVGALVGSHLTHRVPRVYVRLAFIVFLTWTAYKMLTATA